MVDLLEAETGSLLPGSQASASVMNYPSPKLYFSASKNNKNAESLLGTDIFEISPSDIPDPKFLGASARGDVPASSPPRRERPFILTVANFSCSLICNNRLNAEGKRKLSVFGILE